MTTPQVQPLAPKVRRVIRNLVIGVLAFCTGNLAFQLLLPAKHEGYVFAPRAATSATRLAAPLVTTTTMPPTTTTTAKPMPLPTTTTTTWIPRSRREDHVKITKCQQNRTLRDWVDIEVTITNDWDERYDYIIEINVEDAAGNKVGEALIWSSNVEPGKSAFEKGVADGGKAFKTCRVVDVTVR